MLQRLLYWREFVGFVPTTTKEENRRHKPITVVVAAIVNKALKLLDK
jgi:hypothetical protein